MPVFWIEFQDVAMNLKQIQTIKKKVGYNVERQVMSYDIVINDGLNEIFNTRYEFNFDSQEQLDFHYNVLIDKIKITKTVLVVNQIIRPPIRSAIAFKAFIKRLTLNRLRYSFSFINTFFTIKILYHFILDN